MGALQGNCDYTLNVYLDVAANAEDIVVDVDGRYTDSIEGLPDNVEVSAEYFCQQNSEDVTITYRSLSGSHWGKTSADRSILELGIDGIKIFQVHPWEEFTFETVLFSSSCTLEDYPGCVNPTLAYEEIEPLDEIIGVMTPEEMSQWLTHTGIAFGVGCLLLMGPVVCLTCMKDEARITAKCCNLENGLRSLNVLAAVVDILVQLITAYCLNRGQKFGYTTSSFWIIWLLFMVVPCTHILVFWLL